MTWGTNDEDATRTFLASVKPGCDFAVVLNETGAVIGSCGIYPDSANDKAELGWILHKDFWKRGYGTEFCGSLIKYGFEDLKLRRIYAPCAAVNYGSYRIMERNGMRREALRRKAFWARVDKEWVDEAVYSILAEEYFENKRNDEFWDKIDAFIERTDIVIEHPKGSKHLRFDFVYPLDYGYLKDTASPDGGGIDVWLGSGPVKFCDAVICTVDALKKDSEIKLLIGCNESEKAIILQAHNDSESMSGVLIRRKRI
jgi:inorganic pyrophosphatase